MAQDDYYYEIQLTNKQLVFYFMAGATGLVLSFLAGVMVGRGVDAGEVQASRPAQEERITEETPPPPPPTTEDLSYARRLESEKVEEGLERLRPAAGAATPRPATARPAATSRSTPPPPAAQRSATPAAAAATPPPGVKTAAGGPVLFTIQVGAFKDGASAESVVARLKDKGFAAYVVPPGQTDGLFNVRVGNYDSREDAEKVQVRLRDQEKFKPFIVRK